MYELDCPYCSRLLSATNEQLGRQCSCSHCNGALLIQLPGDNLPDVFDMELGPEPKRVFAREMPPLPPTLPPEPPLMVPPDSSSPVPVSSPEIPA